MTAIGNPVREAYFPKITRTTPQVEKTVPEIVKVAPQKPLPNKEDEPILVPNWPVRKKVEAESG
jgi:hypothetical protein